MFKEVSAMAFLRYFLPLYVLFASNLVDCSKKSLPYKNRYGESYGSTWVFFPDEDGKSYNISMVDLPTSRQVDMVDSDYDIQFRLYNDSNNHNSYMLLDQNARPLNDTSLDFQSGAPIKLITHGWMSSADKNSVNDIKNAYLKRKNYYVICVDWSAIADNLFYPAVAFRTKAVGNIVGKFLDALSERYQVTGSRIHLIGHSLGAHVMGNAAYASKLPIFRVTGLDPARPMFEFPPSRNSTKLDPSDAVFVDAIHTCMGILGFEKRGGHADFYPNKGCAPQPGCDGVQKIFEACSHGRAALYFAESIINPKGFHASRCSSWDDYQLNKCDEKQIFMGEECPTSAYGVYYLTTSSSSPYGRNQSN